ncbi:MAG: NAD(+) synthase [Peptococcaceae bacterium]|nr:NAD(+) synthase [Peptococcaceae bacterium]
MKKDDFGFVRAGIGVPQVRVADPAFNVDQIIALAATLAAERAQVAVFPELSVTGYTCGDLFQQRSLLMGAERELERLIRQVQADMLIVVGMPVTADQQLFNCAVAFHRGRILGVVPKTFIPNYSEYYERRWFAPAAARRSDRITLCGQTVPFRENLLFHDENSELIVGIELCEDLWTPIPPSSYHALYGANLLLNLSASNDIAGKKDYRRKLVSQQSARTIAGYVYVSAGNGESTTDVVYGGHSLIAENGILLEERSAGSSGSALVMTADVDIQKLTHDRLRQNNWMERKLPLDYVTVDFALAPDSGPEDWRRTVDPYPFIPGTIEDMDSRCQEIFAIQAAGLRQRLSQTGIKKAVLGLSGGLDSTLAMLVSYEAFKQLQLPAANLIGVSMPGFGTTSRTYGNSIQVMKGLAVSIREIPIQEACLQHFKDIGHDPAIHDVTYENVQARERTQILMDIANKEGGLVVGTGDLSELAMGWATYNGDHMSMYAVNTGVPKTLVSYLVRWYAAKSERQEIREALLDILDTPVSPELLPPDADGKIRQKTEELIGPYALHDFFLYQMIRQGFGPGKILYLAAIAFKDQYGKQEILGWLKLFYRRFFTQQFKRSCLPDGPKVGSVALSPRGDWRMPSDASYALWLSELEAWEHEAPN